MSAMRVLALAGMLGVAPALAGDPVAGGKLAAEKDCAGCHQRLVGGDGSGMYLRPDRRVKSLAQLHAQVSFCSTQLKTGWFPEEEDDVTAWLNHRYYHFK